MLRVAQQQHEPEQARQSAFGTEQSRSPLRRLYHSRHRYRILALSLVALHGAVLLEDQFVFRAACIFVHFGLFLLWQPLWHSSTQLTPRFAALVFAAASAVVFIPGWVPTAIWVLLLIGLLAGEHLPARRDRFAQLVALCFLFVELLLGITPALFEIQSLSPLLAESVRMLLIVLPLTLVFVSASQTDQNALRVDYIRSLAVALFALMLSTGSVLWMYRSETTYPSALFQTLIATTVFLVAINWGWRMQSAHSFFQLLFNRYLLNLDSPLEHYLLKLSDSDAYKLSADDYLEAALQEFSQLDWVAGIAWTADGVERVIGHRTSHMTTAEGKEMDIRVYTHQAVGPTFVLHIQLLARLTEQFFLARKHESQLKKHSHLQAIYETGSRLTHDIKNLLQSLQSVSAVAEGAQPDQAEEALALIKRQLPEINKRLQLTLDKLKRPNVEQQLSERVDRWWESLRKRYLGREVHFNENLLDRTPVPVELFDTVADNLLENARYKRSVDRYIDITVSLTLVGGHIELSVCDTGAAVPADVAEELFTQNVTSSRGLGIGLYHCHELASRFGYRLELKNNRDGQVCFSLAGRAS